MPERPSIPEAETLTGEERQARDLIKAKEPIPGFDGFEVTMTLEKKLSRQSSSAPNQDNVMIKPKLGLVGVFDGLGGHGNGNLASLAAEDSISESFGTYLSVAESMALDDLKAFLLYSQTTKLRQIGAEQVAVRIEDDMGKKLDFLRDKNPDLLARAYALVKSVINANHAVAETGGKTTACVANIIKGQDGSRYAVIANIGDSGAFIRRKDGSIKSVVMEDSVISYYMNRGQLDPELLRRMRNNPFMKFEVNGEQRRYQDMRLQMSASLGGDEQALHAMQFPSLEIIKLEPGDQLFLLTDGILDQFDKNEQLDIKALEDFFKLYSLPGENPLNELRYQAMFRGDLNRLKRSDDMSGVLVRVL